ncbi:MAG: hypothetical protein IKK78_03175 [Oscillospiraceae bacterium]|nr:hypothetical protein [Oscillospiraceae bacterium]
MMFPFSHFMPSFLLYSTGGSGEKPPKKKWTRLVALIIVLAVVLTFFLSLAFERSAKDFKMVCTDMTINWGTLTLSAEYKSIPANYYKIGRDILIATDPDFTEVLPMIDRKDTLAGNALYKFDAKDLPDGQKLYVKPPILFAESESTPVSVSAVVGASARYHIIERSSSSNGDWFTVESIDITEAEPGTYTVKTTLTMNPYSKSILPRAPKLVSGETTYSGSTVPHFDGDDNLDSVEISFSVPADDADAAAALVAESSLNISGALVQMRAQDIAVTSSVKSLSVVKE